MTRRSGDLASERSALPVVEVRSLGRGRSAPSGAMDEGDRHPQVAPRAWEIGTLWCHGRGRSAPSRWCHGRGRSAPSGAMEEGDRHPLVRAMDEGDRHPRLLGYSHGVPSSLKLGVASVCESSFLVASLPCRSLRAGGWAEPTDQVKTVPRGRHVTS